LGYKNIEIIDKSVLLYGDILLEFGGVGKGYLIDILHDMITEYFS
jgi:thiamine biosynthesis lipoprotein ApbE